MVSLAFVTTLEAVEATEEANVLALGCRPLASSESLLLGLAPFEKSSTIPGCTFAGDNLSLEKSSRSTQIWGTGT